MKFIMLFFLWSFSLQAQDLHEFKDSQYADLYAFGFANNVTIKTKWPVTVKTIGHLMQQYQNYGGYPYWHDGLDIITEANEPIYAARGGRVVNIENYRPGNKYYWEVAILDQDGLVWKYHHVLESSIPDNIKKAYQTGEDIPDGTMIGKVIPWMTSSFGVPYHHVHLLVVDGLKQYVNPFLLLTHLRDTTPPTIRSVILAEDGKLKPQTQIVSSRHQIFIDAFDVLDHPSLIHPPHALYYSLDGLPPVEITTFNHLLTTNDEDYIHDFYHPDSCGNYVCRKFYINVGFTKNNPKGFFNLPSGSHQIQITLMDFIGLKTEKIFSYSVK